MNKLIAVIYILFLACAITSCAVMKQDKPEGKLIGTLSVYRTPTGALSVVNDQDGNSMLFEWNLGRVLVPEKKEDK